MDVLIRADASAQAGGGHVARCIALAEAINAGGGKTVFATREDARAGRQMLESAGIPYVRLPPGDDWREDAEATRPFVRGMDWVVIDHYGLDARWQRAVSEEGAGVVVIDDLANRPHDCAILVDPGRSVTGRADYDSYVPAECDVLMGPLFVMLRSGFGDVRAARSERTHTNLLVFFGSADNQNLTARSLDAIDNINFEENLSVHVLLTSATHNAGSIRERSGIVVHENVVDMASLIADMDIALGAGGVSMWERCSLGVPSLTIGVNQNQMPGLQLAEAAGAIRTLKMEDVLKPDTFEEAIRLFVTARQEWAAMASSARNLVDGRGAQRIVTQMGPLTLRAAVPADCELLWQWANDTVVQAMAFNSDPIPLEEHRVWFAAEMKTRGSLIFISEQAGTPIGQVRFDVPENGVDSDEWTIDISLAPEFRGQNLGIEVLQKAMVLFRRVHTDAPVIAWVKTANVPAAGLFEAAGFRRTDCRHGAERFIFR